MPSFGPLHAAALRAELASMEGKLDAERRAHAASRAAAAAREAELQVALGGSGEALSEATRAAEEAARRARGARGVVARAWV